MILFHFHVASEKLSKNHETTAGLGHAVRCRAVSNLLNGDSIFCVNRSNEAEKYCRVHKLNFIFEDNLDDFLLKNQVKLIISDINYLNHDYIKIYETHRVPTVCLAPRGKFKHMSSLAFSDILDRDVNIHEMSCDEGLKIGFDHVIIRDEILSLRSTCAAEKNRQKIIISMGGSDTFDMTSKVIKNLVNLPSEFMLEIVLGELYDKKASLSKICEQNLSCEYNIVQSPKNFPLLLSSSTIGIFGSGIVTYEALCLGVIPLNFGHSEFHAKRASEIEKSKAGFYIGDFRKKQYFPELLEKINYLYADEELMRAMSSNAMSVIDGKGLSRMVQAIKNKNWI